MNNNSHILQNKSILLIILKIWGAKARGNSLLQIVYEIFPKTKGFPGILKEKKDFHKRCTRFYRSDLPVYHFRNAGLLVCI